MEAKLALMPKEEQTVEEAKLKKPLKEISGLQDYMSSYFTPEQGRRSRRRTQHYEVDTFQKVVQPKKRKSVEDDSSGEKGRKKMFHQSSSAGDSQVSLQLKEIE